MSEDCSMTPPWSPTQSLDLMEDIEWDHGIQHVNQDAPEVSTIDISLIRCSGEVDPTHKGKNLSRNLDELFQLHLPPYACFRDSSVELFDCYGYIGSALRDSIDELFCLVRQKITVLESSVSVPQGSKSCADELVAIRKQIRLFLEYIKIFLIKYMPTSSKEDSDAFAKQLVGHINILQLHIGRLHELPPTAISNGFSKNGNKCPNTVYHMWHLHLEVHWSLVEIVYIMNRKYPDIQFPNVVMYSVNDDSREDLCTQYILLLIWDLTLIAMDRHNKISTHEYPREYEKTSPFPCSCVRELWMSCLYVTDHRQTQTGQNSFWMIIQGLIQTILNNNQKEIDDSEWDSTKFPLPPDYTINNALGFCWWILYHLAPLYQHQDNPLVVTSNYTSCNTLVRNMCSLQSPVSELVMRCYLRCILGLSQLWERNIVLVATLWEYFSKKLNNLFYLPTLGLKEMTQLPSSHSEWLNICLSRINSERGVKQDNSFHIFLRILGAQLRSEDQTHPVVEWKQLKGRFLSKFHKRLMNDLTDTGLMNFTSLFVTLTQLGNLEDLGGRMVDLYELINFETTTVNKKSVIVKGLFMLVLLYQKKNLDIGSVAVKLASIFDQLCRYFGSEVLDRAQSNLIWPVIMVYMEGMQEVFENSEALCLSEGKLLGSCMMLLLKSCNQNELRQLLNVFEMIMARHRSIYKRVSPLMLGDQNNVIQELKCVADSLWKTVYPFIKSHSCTNTPPSQLADVAACFTLLVLDMPPSPASHVQEDISSIFKFFSQNTSVSHSISASYMVHLLPNQMLLDKIQTNNQDLESHLVQAWFRCCLYTGAKASNSLQELTRLIFKLKEITGIIKVTDTGSHHVQQSNTVLHVIKAIGVGYLCQQTFQSKITYRSKVQAYFTDVSKSIRYILKDCGSMDDIRNIYNICGHLVKYCANLLYVKSKSDCLLPDLITLLVLPQALFSNGKKPLPSYLMSGTKEFLYLFVQGLGKLEPQRDPFISRCLSDITNHYMMKFPLKSGSTSSAVHPLVSSLNKSFVKNPTQDASTLHEFLLTTILDQHLSMISGTLPNNGSIALQYIGEVLQKTTSTHQVIRDSMLVLPTILNLLMKVESATQLQYLNKLCRYMLEACKRSQDQTISDRVLEILKNFTVKHKMQMIKMLANLEMISKLYPDCIVNLIPDITLIIRECEERRGVGKDTGIRQKYLSLLQNLGDVGHKEIESFLRN